jgi:hypothetical protein
VGRRGSGVLWQHYRYEPCCVWAVGCLPVVPKILLDAYLVIQERAATPARVTGRRSRHCSRLATVRPRTLVTLVQLINCVQTSWYHLATMMAARLKPRTAFLLLERGQVLKQLPSPTAQSKSFRRFLRAWNPSCFCFHSTHTLAADTFAAWSRTLRRIRLRSFSAPRRVSASS